MKTRIAYLGLALFVMSLASCTAWVQYNKSPQIFSASSAGLYQSGLPVPDAQAIRVTRSGQIQGFADAYDTQAWLGIPYAAAPVGDLRWKAPRPAPVWQGTRSALEYGNACMQFAGPLAGEEGENGQVVGSEDCLTLNVWAPRAGSEEAGTAVTPKPVMVWIHGGGNDSGTARLYQAHNLAGSKDVVVVLINYRLGLLGWLSHDVIRQTSDNALDASGNYGTLDIIAALQWVQENIGQFGGDAGNVTIFGESAGGRNVFSMLASPLAKGLFHKAISQSGSADTTLQTLAEEYPDARSEEAIFGLENSSSVLLSQALGKHFGDTEELAKRVRLQSMPAAQVMQKMRSMDAAELMQMAAENIGQPGYMKVARIIRDGYVIPRKSVLELMRDPQSYNAVPLILGSNRDEQKLFLARNPEYVDYRFGMLPRIKDVPRYDRVSEFVSENWKAGAVDEPARRVSAHGAMPVFAYRFDWDESPSNWLADLPTLIGAAHGLEISFVFGDFTGGVDLDALVDRQNAAGRQALSSAMMDYWAAFAHRGDPGAGLSGEQTPWQAWAEQGDNLLLLDTANDGGIRMAEQRSYVADIKQRIPTDDILANQRDRCEAYAVLFLHGYQASDFWSPAEYQALGCADFPAGEFRES